MELDFSNKGLLTFDASYLGRGPEKSSNSAASSAVLSGDDSVLASLLDRAPVVKGINISHNALSMFVGGETLRHVTLLDLSHNSLSVLNTNSLPPALVKLNLGHNHLNALGGLARHVSALKELNISFNAFTASGLRDFPTSLVTLHMQGNEADSLSALKGLKHLSQLDASGNCLEDARSIEGLWELPCLRHLELCDNGVMCEAALRALVSEMAPRLASLNGEPLSQATNNSAYKAKQAVAARAASSVNTSRLNTSLSQQPVQGGSRSGSVRPAAPAAGLARSRSSDSGITSKLSRAGAPPAPPSPALIEIRLMEAKLTELRRLVAEADGKEKQARYERGILIDQIRSCAGVIQSQAQELDALQQEIEELHKEEECLKGPVAKVEQTFEQTHASLIAQRVDKLTAGGVGTSQAVGTGIGQHAKHGGTSVPPHRNSSTLH